MTLALTRVRGDVVALVTRRQLNSDEHNSKSLLLAPLREQLIASELDCSRITFCCGLWLRGFLLVGWGDHCDWRDLLFRSF